VRVVTPSRSGPSSPSSDVPPRGWWMRPTTRASFPCAYARPLGSASRNSTTARCVWPSGRTRSARQGVGEDLYCSVGSGDDSGLSVRERLAVEYAERFAVDHTSIDDRFMERMRSSFTDAEIFDLTVCLSAFLGLGRTLRALGITETRLTDV